MRAEFDIVVAGGGLVGLSIAAALRASGLRLALVDPHPPAAPAGEAWDSRIYAISPGTAGFLEALGAWQALDPDRLTRIEYMDVCGDDRAARLRFSAYDAGLRELAFTVESGRLQQALQRAADEAPLRMFRPAACASLHPEPDAVTLTLSDGTELRARLLVGADGADSWVRAAAGIAVVPVDYGQLAVVANYAAERPHGGVAYQWFLRDGVLALLPLPGNRISMVWSTAREHARELMEATHQQLAAATRAAAGDALGELEVITPPAAFPLRLQRVARFVCPRIALAGDAAHNVHPLAGQGVNLGFRDARALAAVLATREGRYDCGDYALLRRYERARKEDVAAIELTTHGLQKLFAAEAVWLARARNSGLRLVNTIPGLKNLLVRQAAA